VTNTELRDQIAAKSGILLQRANETGIEQLRSLKAPEDAIAFYREAEPAECAEIEKIRIWPIKDVVEENTNYVPGCWTEPSVSLPPACRRTVECRNMPTGKEICYGCYGEACKFASELRTLSSRTICASRKPQNV
jgi:hypothetical protein